MPFISDHVEVEHKPKLGGGGPGKIPRRHGFGGGDDGDHGPRDDFLSRRDRLRHYRAWVVLAIISVTMVFIALSSAYFIRQGMGRWDQDARRYINDWRPLVLPYGQLLINTAILVLSSVTVELARRGLMRRWEFSVLGIRPPSLSTELPWLAATVALGAGFLGGQLMVWTTLRNQGIYLSSNPSSSFFYLLTGLHAIHLVGGLVVLLCALLGSWASMRLESQQIAVDVTGWYWHFMGALWIYIVALLHFAR